MKLQTQKKEVTKSEAFETVNYGVDIRNLPLLFEMLRTNLYSDIYGSIIREVVSNVVDAHTEAGKTDAVGEVEWIDENRLIGVDNQLIIRDFGIGLSPERMRTVYGNYLTSTKRDSNDQIGGFGLGSKVPFAYTDSFFVQTAFDGMQYKYLCYIDETGLGAISLLESAATDKENGTEIVIPVKNKFDKQRFQDAIFKQLSYFRNIRYINFTAPENEVLYEDEHCIVIKKAPYPDLHLLLGNVAYPIDFQAAGIDRWSGDVANCYLGIKFNVGDLQPTLSRESVFWTEQVKKKVHAKIVLARKSIRTQIEKELANEKDYAKWYAAVNLRKTKSFPNQWQFSKVSTSAEYKPSDGSPAMQINTLQGDWFAGMNIRTVTPYTGYSRRRKVNSKNNPEYSTYGSSLDDILHMPLYQTEGTLTARKSLFLFKTNPKGFVIVNDKGIDELDTTKQTQLAPYHKQSKKWKAGLKKFEDIVVPDGEFEATSDDEWKEAYRKLVKQRKLEGKFVAKKVYRTDAFGGGVENNFAFGKFESKFEDHKEGLIIYGTQEHEKQLFRIAAMMTFCAKYTDKFDQLKDINVLKVGQHYLKQFAQMPNAYEVTEVFQMKTGLNQQLADIMTAHKFEEHIHPFRLLRDFEGINTEMRNKFVALEDFVKENTQNKRWHEIGLLKELVDLCEANGLINEDMEAHFEEIEEFFEGAELLRYVTFDKNAIEPIKDYLVLKGKELDNQVVTASTELVEGL